MQPQPYKEFDKPWRKIHWGEKKNLEMKLRRFRVSSQNVRHIRILVVGEIAGGKSSFINSVNNAFQGRITCNALVAAASGTSFTKKYKTHYIDRGDGFPLPFVFNDIMGLEGAKDCGARVEDITKALEGLVKEGYKFNPANPSTSKDHDRHVPSLGDQTYCLVNIIGADKISRMDNKVIEKIRYIREKATELEMPQVIIMTRVDEACPLVKEDLRKVYTSKKIKEKMQECSNCLGVPMNHIFPVKNYHEEIDTDDDMDILILKALDQIVNIANDALRRSTSSFD
ncbi:interferon-induced protein 44-like isoform X1 [Brachyhypopomus gauderio]|uniref:interferon-induced protein 44-like isoform X1 n=1 Tax=Brachyhypopomus gauderio TaxID=698409 RepID=UPI0040412620